MDENLNRNSVILCGTLCAAPSFSHQGRGERFYTFPVEVSRLSGATDKINVIAREELLQATELTGAGKVYIIGELRSFNNKSGEGAKLVISVFAKEISLCDEPDRNEVHLVGTLCKEPNLRMTPMGRDICDLMLAVNRRYGRSDYLPCITWGLRAREAADWVTGTVVSLDGRIQSRSYIKILDGVPYEKTAFEVSVTEIDEFT